MVRTVGQTRDGVRLGLALERVAGLVRRLAPPGDLSLAAAAVLRRLTDDGAARLSELAESEGISQPAMTQLVSRLERDGLVSRGGSPDDGRVVLVAATEAGRDRLARRREHRAAALAELLDRLDPAEHAAVLAAVPALDRLALLAGAASAAHRPRPRPGELR